MAPGLSDESQRSALGKAPNLILRRIREQERYETRAEFAEAMAGVARETGESVYPDAKYVERLESGISGIRDRPTGVFSFNCAGGRQAS